MTNRIVTRGMGGGQDVGLVLMGFTFEEAIRVIRGGRTVAKDLYENFLEEFTIAAKLMEVNGKELLSPIINKRKYIIDESVDHKVNVTNLRVSTKESSNTSVFAKLLKISRGSDGKD
jgi:hypothetical protein